MSRSHRHSPISSVTCRGCKPGAEKWWKRKASRKLRRLTRLLENDDVPEPLPREVASVWAWPKDGKHYFGDCRDDPDFKKWMSK